LCEGESHSEGTIVSWSGHATLFWTLDMKNLEEKPKEQSVLSGSQVTLQKEDLEKMDTLQSIAYAHEHCQCWVGVVA